jgi:predicted TIM-barrel fold metal-dependent hydrolase
VSKPTERIEVVLSDTPLVDGHCHSILAGGLDPGGFALAATEADAAPPAGISLLDGQVGLAIRRWCAPVLDLPAGAPMDEYLARRAELGADEVNGRLLGAAGLSHLLVDTGLDGPELVPPGELGRACGAEVREVVRLERVAERLADNGVTAYGFASAYRAALAEAAKDAVAVKSVLAYRYGFGTDNSRPVPAAVRIAAGRWLAGGRPARLDEPVLLRFVLWCAVDLGLPVQIHTGFGDRDLRLAASDPALLQEFLAATEPRGVPVVLLHCYPYHRQAGWLAQVFPHVYVDVGLTVAQVGTRADAVLAEFFELAPFGKVLFSTDGYALPELFLVGAAQFRHSLARLLTTWVTEGAMSTADARRMATMVAADNACRLYGLQQRPGHIAS